MISSPAAITSSKAQPAPVTDQPPLLAAAILAAAVLLLFLTAPRQEDFWWTDAPSIALNGELVRDYIAAGFPHAPLAFANAWFLRYPALSISLYPPLFPMAEAAMFAVFGFSHPVAQAAVAAFTALAAYGAYLTARTALPPLAAAGFTLLLFATPGMMLWSRQVMMEIPSLAFLLIGTAVLLRYQAAGGSWRLLLATAMVLAGVYTKQTAILATAAFGIALLLGGRAKPATPARRLARHTCGRTRPIAPHRLHADICVSGHRHRLEARHGRNRRRYVASIVRCICQLCACAPRHCGLAAAGRCSRLPDFRHLSRLA